MLLASFSCSEYKFWEVLALTTAFFLDCIFFLYCHFRLNEDNKVTVTPKTGRFDNIVLAVIISRVSKAIVYCLARTADDDC